MKKFIKKELPRTTILGIILFICLAATYYFHFVRKIEVIFTHLFYIPIILGGLWWNRRGIAVAVLLAVTLLSSHIISPLATPIGADIARAFMFLVVGTAVALLTEKKEILANKLQTYSETLEKKVAQRTSELRQLLEKEQAILYGIGDAIIVLGEDLSITWANSIAKEQYGAVQGKKCYEAMKWLKKPCAECIVRKAFADGVSRKSEEEDILKDGSRINFITNCSPVRDSNGKISSVVEVLHDITEHKQAEEEKRKLENRYRLIAENTSDLITIHTFDTKISYTYVSPSIKTIAGYEPEKMLGRSAFDFIHPEDKKLLFPLLKKYIGYKLKNLIAGKEATFSETVEFRYKQKSGDWIYMQSVGNIVADQLLFVSRDITERKQWVEEISRHRDHLEELVKARTAELEQKNAELERFNNLFVDREFRVKELRDRVAELEKMLNDE
jgi:PAS domain S-box-containing protein